MLLLLGRRDPVDELPDEVGIEHRKVGEKVDVAVPPDRRQRARGQVEVGRAEGDRLLEQGVDRQGGGGCVLGRLHGCTYRQLPGVA